MDPQTAPPLQQNKQQSSYSTHRLRIQTAKKLRQLLTQANRKELGRPVKADALILYALSLIKDEHIVDLQLASYSNADRIELKFREYQKSHGKVSRDEFLGLMLKNGENLLETTKHEK